MRCPFPGCKKTAIKVVNDPFHIYRCLGCGKTFAPILATKAEIDGLNARVAAATEDQNRRLEEQVRRDFGEAL